MAQFVNPYENNYATLSSRIGGAVEGAVDERQQLMDRKRAEEDRAIEEQRRASQDEMRNLQLGQMKAREQEGLIVSGDSGINQLDTAVNSASRALVDQAGSLTTQLKNNEITSDEFASQYALIKSQVPAIKKFKETLGANIAEYTAGIKGGQLSGAMGNDVDDLYTSLINGTGDVQLGIGEDGQVTFSGTTANGEEINIPASGANQIPKPIMKAPAPYETFKEPMAVLAQTKGAWDEGMEGNVTNQFDQIADNDKALLAMAVDHYGIPLAEAKRLQSEIKDGGNALQDVIEPKFIEDAKITFKEEREKFEDAQIKQKIEEQRLFNLERQVNRQDGQFAIQQEQHKMRQEEHEQKTQALQAAKEQKALVHENNVSMVQNLDFSSPANTVDDLRKKGITDVVWDKKNGYIVLNPNNPEKPKAVLGKSAEALQQHLYKTLGIDESAGGGTVEGQLPSPLGRSPFKRLANWASNIIKK